MNDELPFEKDPALFRQWLRHQPAEFDFMPPDFIPPDFMTLAAYAEGNATAAESALVEAALAADPALLDATLALGGPITPEIPSAALLRRAQGLRAAPSHRRVLPFAPAARRRLSPILAWGALAASLVLMSLVGFDVGIRAERATMPAAFQVSPLDLLDQSELG
jgi:hypothetical protein